MGQDNKETYIAFAICTHQYGCGCEYTTHVNVYAKNGNSIKRFTSYKDAENAAIKKMIEVNGDNWNVV